MHVKNIKKKVQTLETRLANILYLNTVKENFNHLGSDANCTFKLLLLHKHKMF